MGQDDGDGGGGGRRTTLPLIDEWGEIVLNDEMIGETAGIAPKESWFFGAEFSFSYCHVSDVLCTL